MEPQTPPSPPLPKPPTTDHSLSTIDTSRPFTSVKEAIAIFGQKLLAGELYPSPSPKPFSNQTSSMWRFSPSPIKTKDIIVHDHEHNLLETLKKLEAELEETKVELKLLKEREAETEVAVASLNAELHKNMSKIAKAEAVAAKEAAVVAARADSLREEDRKRRETVESSTLAQILSIGDHERLFGGREQERKRMMKKKPIVPLLGDLFSRKKGSASSVNSSLYSSTHVYLN